MTGKRALTFPIGKVAIDGSGTSGLTVTIGAGSATIGKVDVSGPTSVFDVAVKTDLSNTTPFQLGNNAGLKIGIKITNLDTAATIFVGSSSVSATRFVTQLFPGQTSDWLPCENSNAYYVLSSVANGDFCYGGG